MNRFLSDESIALHSDYVRIKRLKYSIIESSVPRLKGAKIKDIYRMRIAPYDKRDALDLLSEIALHELFFASFSKAPYPASQTVRSAYGSEANFLNTIYKMATSLPYGFILVYSLQGRVEIRECTDFKSAYYRSEPVLALDVCEHVYFSDYGFDKERYLSESLPYLDLTRLTDSQDVNG